MSALPAMAEAMKCLMRQNDSYKKGAVAVCARSGILCDNVHPDDSHCGKRGHAVCVWFYCDCERPTGPTANDTSTCESAECFACALVHCGEPLHYHHDGCPKCDMDDIEG